MRARAPAFPVLASLLHKKIPFLGKAFNLGFLGFRFPVEEIADHNFFRVPFSLCIAPWPAMAIR